MKKICVLIPSYNEAKTIGEIVQCLAGRHLPVYVIDDGSIDETATLARTAGARIISHTHNLGKGAALRAGFSQAITDGYDAMLIMDGDNQHAIEDVAHLIRVAHESDVGIVIGNRMHDTASMPVVRNIVNRFMSWLIALVARQQVPDTQCGFRVIKKEVLAAITLTSSNFEIESEMIIKAARKGFRITSVPIRTVYRDERSKIKPVVDTFRFIIFMCKIAFRHD